MNHKMFYPYNLTAGVFLFIVTLSVGCRLQPKKEASDAINRPCDIWVFRSVMDNRPRMITIGLNKRLWLSYSTEAGSLYKAWSGSFTGKIFTDGEQPRSSGNAYFEEPDGNPWHITTTANENEVPLLQYKGHVLKDSAVTLKYELDYKGNKILVSESPEYFPINDSIAGFERKFTVRGLPKGYKLLLSMNPGRYCEKLNVAGASFVSKSDNGNVSIGSWKGVMEIQVDGESTISYELKESVEEKQSGKSDHVITAADIIGRNDCSNCHNKEAKTVGPSYKAIAERYASIDGAREKLADKIIKGGTGSWGEVAMSPHGDLSRQDALKIVDYIFSISKKSVTQIPKQTLMPKAKFSIGFKSVSPQSILADEKGVAINVYSSAKKIYGFGQPTKEEMPVAAGIFNAIHLTKDDFAEDWKEDFTMVAIGQLRVDKAGKIRFRMVCDDGARLFIDGRELLRSSGNYASIPSDTLLFLTPGLHPFKVDYFQRDGGKTLSLQWQLPGTTSFEPIPPSAFYFDRKDIKQTGKTMAMDKPPVPGDMLPLASVHPSLKIEQARPADFTARVGAMDFLPDGRLVVCSWDSLGAVYILSNVQGTDPSSIKVKRIASGLAEVLGMKVVEGNIYVLQKQELTKLLDTNKDDIIDEYQVVSNGWKVSANFHEFAFGLAYQDGYFYGTFATALIPGGASSPDQMPGRGGVIKIALKDGSFQFIASGLRTPNGIGTGLNDEIFITDNQGDWLPANKLVQLQENAWYGSRAVNFEGTENKKPTLPIVYLPQDEIANSPSQPALLNQGIYRDQLIYGDVTYGGIQRVFKEKVNGQYQGCVFQFSQGLEAGVNRLVWGPDGKLYAGGCGQRGNWAQTGKFQYGLQRLAFTDKITFEMLAVRAKPGGLEIEFTKALNKNVQLSAKDFTVRQWWYLPTPEYGGPKMDEEKLAIKNIRLLEEGKKVFIELDDMKAEHLIYLRLDRDKIKSNTGEQLWSTETWYTMNQLPTR